jgi:Na+/melibiose symporter-like transporter
LLRIDKADAGIASAMVDTTQQVGGAIGTAVLNTIFASAVTGYLADQARNGSGRPPGAATATLAAIHGYQVAFWTGAGLLVATALITAVLINATRQQMSAVAEHQQEA